jgi:hypothetical protein
LESNSAIPIGGCQICEFEVAADSLFLLLLVFPDQIQELAITSLLSLLAALSCLAGVFLGPSSSADDGTRGTSMDSVMMMIIDNVIIFNRLSDSLSFTDDQST